MTPAPHTQRNHRPIIWDCPASPTRRYRKPMIWDNSPPQPQRNRRPIIWDTCPSYSQKSLIDDLGPPLAPVYTGIINRWSWTIPLPNHNDHRPIIWDETLALHTRRNHRPMIWDSPAPPTRRYRQPMIWDNSPPQPTKSPTDNLRHPSLVLAEITDRWPGTPALIHTQISSTHDLGQSPSQTTTKTSTDTLGHPLVDKARRSDRISLMNKAFW